MYQSRVHLNLPLFNLGQLLVPLLVYLSMCRVKFRTALLHPTPSEDGAEMYARLERQI